MTGTAYAPKTRPPNEFTALLSNPSRNIKSSDEANYEQVNIDGKSETFWMKIMVSEAKMVVDYAWPLLITYLVGLGMKLVDVWFLGRLGSQVMAVASLGNLFTTVGGIAVGTGLLTAVETLVAQAYTGASDPKTLGIIFQRGLIIMALISIPISILWLFAESILAYMGQSPELAHLAQQFLYFCIPFIYPVFVSTSIRKFLQSLGKMRITMYMLICVFPLNLVSNFIFLDYLQLGYIGAACHVLTFHLIVLAVFSLFLLFGTNFRTDYWPGWSKHALSSWDTFLKLGVPGMLSVSTDWAFEVCALVAGTLGKTSLAGQSIVLAVNSFLLEIPNAISRALATRVGHLLGADQPHRIKACIIVTVSGTISIVAFDAVLMYALKSRIAQHFTTDAEVQAAVLELMPVACASHLFAGAGHLLSAVLNAYGRQPMVAAVNISSFYVLGLPFGIYLTYAHGWGLVGIWSGVVVAGFIKCASEAYLLLFVTDAETECRRSSRLVHHQETMAPQLPIDTRD